MDQQTVPVFGSRSHTRALADVAFALDRGAACVVVTGPSGIGKSTLCRELALTGDARTFSTVILDPTINADELLVRLLQDFGLIADRTPRDVARDPAKLAAAAERFLLSLRPLGAHAVVVVDDAERASSEVLSTLQRLVMVGRPDNRLLRLVLVGQPSIEARLQEPGLELLNSLVDTRVSIEPLERDEVLAYAAHRSGAALLELSPERIDEVYRESEGIPSRVNFCVARPLQADGFGAGAADGVGPGAPVPATRSSWPRWLTVAVPVLVVVVGVVWFLSRGTGPSAAPAAPSAQGSPPPGGRGVESASPPAATAAVPAPQPTAPPVPPTASTPLDGSAYRVAVAAFRTKVRAEQIADQLRNGQASAIRVDQVGEWHQVVAGPYLTLEEAREAQRAFTKVGFPETRVVLPTAQSGVSPGSPELPPR